MLAVETEEFDAQKLIRRLGGTIKIGVIDGELPAGDYKKMAKAMFELAYSETAPGKFKFGISYYGKAFNIKPIGMELKNFLKEAGQSARWVISREPVLSSVVVEQNKLVGKGVEFVLIPQANAPLIKGGRGILLGRTLAVQAFKELSFRDYGRPGRDDRSGMLPPKLAQILINLATPLVDKEGGILLDPFCGSGTVLTEAVLMGFRDLIGSDISEKAVEDTEKNLEWIKEKFSQAEGSVKVMKLSAAELSKNIPAGSIAAIATEPYLGPQRGQLNKKQVIRELEDLYSKSMAEFKQVLRPGGRVAMVWPVFDNTYSLNPDTGGLRIVSQIPVELRANKIIRQTHRHTIVYGREGQKVWREIVVLEK